MCTKNSLANYIGESDIGVTAQLRYSLLMYSTISIFNCKNLFIISFLGGYKKKYGIGIAIQS